MSKRMPAAGIMVREITANFEDTWHPAQRRQYVISLGGAVDITASDGETRHIAAGEIVVEDTTGKGHITSHPAAHPATRYSCRSIKIVATVRGNGTSGFSVRSQLLIDATFPLCACKNVGAG